MKRLFIGLALLVVVGPAFADTADDYLADVYANVSTFLDDAETISRWSCVVTDDVVYLYAEGNCESGMRTITYANLFGPKGGSVQTGNTGMTNGGCEPGSEGINYNFGSAAQALKLRAGLTTICKAAQ